ncbi:MAG: CorA family divalent cation transporter [Nakamurella sp.]
MTATAHAQLAQRGHPTRSVIWRGGHTVGTDLPPDQIAAEFERDDAIRAWWLLPRDADALADTADLLGLDQFAIDDVLGPREAPKLDVVGETVLIVTAALSFDAPSAELAIQRVSILATDRALVVIADDGPLSTLGPLLNECEPRMRADGIAAGLHIVLDSLMDNYSAALESMEEATDLLTAALFDDKPMGKAEQLRAFRMRQAIGHLRKVATPMVEVTNSLANAAGLPAEQEKNDPIARVLGTTMARRFSDVADHARHAADGTGALRDMLNSAYETNLSLADVHLNMIMKKLSAWAAIIAVPTLITGFMGMNVPYPGFSETGGFIAALVVMIGAVSTLFVLFRRSDWL